MKRILCLRSKLELLTAIGIVVVLVGASGIWATTWTISSTNDNKSTFIRCSNGNYYEATQANLQTALNLGGTIFLPDCNITIGDTGLTMSVDNTQLIGQGNSSILCLGTSTAFRHLLNITADGTLVKNIRFDANNASQTYSSSIYTIYFALNTQDNVVDGCWFYRGCSFHINSAPSLTCYKKVIQNNYFYARNTSGFGGAVAFRGGYCVAKNNYIENTYATGITMEVDTTGDTYLIDGNIITGLVSVPIYVEGIIKANATIVNNIIYDFNGTAYGSSVPDGIGILCGSYSTVSNNHIYNAGRYGISAEDNCTITGNVILETRGAAVIVAEENNIISNNVIINQVTGAASYPTYGIRFKTGVVSGNRIEGTTSVYFNQAINARNENCVIVGNYISNCKYGIDLETHNATVTGNFLTGCSTTGIRLYDDNVNCTIMGNIVRVSGTGIDEDTNSDWNIIVGNNCLGCTTPIDKNGASTVCEHNLGTVS